MTFRSCAFALPKRYCDQQREPGQVAVLQERSQLLSQRASGPEFRDRNPQVSSSHPWISVVPSSKFIHSFTFHISFPSFPLFFPSGCDRNPPTNNNWVMIVGVVPPNFPTGKKFWVGGAPNSWGYIAGTGGKVSAEPTRFVFHIIISTCLVVWIWMFGIPSRFHIFFCLRFLSHSFLAFRVMRPQPSVRSEVRRGGGHHSSGSELLTGDDYFFQEWSLARCGLLEPPRAGACCRVLHSRGCPGSASSGVIVIHPIHPSIHLSIHPRKRISW